MQNSESTKLNIPKGEYKMVTMTPTIVNIEWKGHVFVTCKSYELAEIAKDAYNTHQKDPRLPSELLECNKQCSELLALIHGNGGHYESKHGKIKAIKDAIDLFGLKWHSTDALVDTNNVLEENKRLNVELSNYAYQIDSAKIERDKAEQSNLQLQKQVDELRDALNAAIELMDLAKPFSPTENIMEATIKFHKLMERI